jgi:hypothetical protein
MNKNQMRREVRRQVNRQVKKQVNQANRQAQSQKDIENMTEEEAAFFLRGVGSIVVFIVLDIAQYLYLFFWLLTLFYLYFGIKCALANKYLRMVWCFIIFLVCGFIAVHFPKNFFFGRI